LLELGSRDTAHDRYRYAGATPAGALLGVAGAAALFAGIYRWWQAPAASAPSLGLIHGGAVAGWATAF
jgi:hypothetical protein